MKKNAPAHAQIKEWELTLHVAKDRVSFTLASTCPLSLLAFEIPSRPAMPCNMLPLSVGSGIGRLADPAAAPR